MDLLPNDFGYILNGIGISVYLYRVKSYDSYYKYKYRGTGYYTDQPYSVPIKGKIKIKVDGSYITKVKIDFKGKRGKGYLKVKYRFKEGEYTWGYVKIPWGKTYNITYCDVYQTAPAVDVIKFLLCCLDIIYC